MSLKGQPAQPEETLREHADHLQARARQLVEADVTDPCRWAELVLDITGGQLPNFSPGVVVRAAPRSRDVSRYRGSGSA